MHTALMLLFKKCFLHCEIVKQKTISASTVVRTYYDQLIVPLCKNREVFFDRALQALDESFLTGKSELQTDMRHIACDKVT